MATRAVFGRTSYTVRDYGRKRDLTGHLVLNNVILSCVSNSGLAIAVEQCCTGLGILHSVVVSEHQAPCRTQKAIKEWPTWMCPGSLSCVASMNIAWATLGFSTALDGGQRKLATGSPPYLYTSLPSSRATGANIASVMKGKTEAWTTSDSSNHNFVHVHKNQSTTTHL